MKKYNTHSLIHLLEDNERFGPIKNYNAYEYENYLRLLKKLVKSSKNLVQQISTKLLVSQLVFTSSDLELTYEIYPEKDELLRQVSDFLGLPIDAKYYLAREFRGNKFKSHLMEARYKNKNIRTLLLTIRLSRLITFVHIMMLRSSLDENTNVKANLKSRSKVCRSAAF